MMDEFKVKLDKMINTVSVVSGKYDLSFFIILRNMGKKCVLEWCMSMGLITDKYECPLCKKSMKLSKRTDTTDGYEWICRIRKGNKHDIMRSVRNGSFFQHSRTTIINILILTYFWIKNVPSVFIEDELGMSRRSIIDWLHNLREFCVDLCIISSTMIGGSGVVIELVESNCGKKKKTNLKGKLTAGKWMYGGSEFNTGQCFLQLVDVRCKEALLTVLENYVLPGTIIISNCWREYNCIKDDDFMLLAANRGFTFKEPCIESDENSIFGLRSKVKSLPHGNRRTSEQFDSHLAEFMWRKLNSGSPQHMFQTFLRDIVNVFPPCAMD